MSWSDNSFMDELAVNGNYNKDQLTSMSGKDAGIADTPGSEVDQASGSLLGLFAFNSELLRDFSNFNKMVVHLKL